MASFKDTNGKLWTVLIDAPTIMEVRSATCSKPASTCRHRQGAECDGLDLAATDGQAWLRMLDNEVLLIETLFVVLTDQAREAGVEYKAFARGVTGDVLGFASNALLEAITDFFPKEKRELLKATMDQETGVRKLGMTKALAKINDPELRAKVEAAVEQRIDSEIADILTQFSSATNTPELSASTPRD